MDLGTALSIASKLQAPLELPWAGIIFLIGLWIGRIKVLSTIILWMTGSIMTLVGGVLLFTPYQLFHWQRLWKGIQSERLAQTNAEVNLLDWIEYTVSNELVGYSYSFLLLLTLFSFIRRIYQNRRNLREWLSRSMPALFISNLIWVVIGAGYVYVGVEVLIARYLIHVVPSLMLLTFVGVYWLSITPKKKSQFAWVALLVVLVVTGLQQQTKHASFDFRVRKQIAERLVYIRLTINELKNIVPRESHILNPLGQYIDPQWFVNSHHGYPTRQMVNQLNIEYLLLIEGYPDSLKREGVSLEDSGKSVEYQEKINFWKALIQDGLEGQFQIIRQFKDARLTLYRRVIRD